MPRKRLNNIFNGFFGACKRYQNIRPVSLIFLTYGAKTTSPASAFEMSKSTSFVLKVSIQASVPPLNFGEYGFFGTGKLKCRRTKFPTPAQKTLLISETFGHGSQWQMLVNNLYQVVDEFQSTNNT